MVSGARPLPRDAALSVAAAALKASPGPGDIYNRMVRFVADGRRRAAARHFGSRDAAALRAARRQPVALGGDEGYASIFAFGHSLRG